MAKIGLIGCGVVASYGHLPAITSTPGLNLVSLLDVNPTRLADMQQRFNAPHAFTNIDEFFKSDLDAVVITSPAPNHREHVEAAARYGKPVLCEKPLAMSETEAQGMIDTMSTVGLPLYVGFTYRFAPVALEIHRLVRERGIGDVRSLRLAYLWDCHGKYKQRADTDSGLYDRRHERMIEGGPLVDCGVHQIDLARWWTGSEVRRVTGLGAWVETEGYTVPDHVHLHMDHQSGAHTAVEISFTYCHTARDERSQFYYELIGTDGVIRYDRQGRYFELVNRDGTRRLEWTEEKNFYGMYTEFERALREGTSGNMPTAADGLIATKLARQATESAVHWRNQAA